CLKWRSLMTTKQQLKGTTMSSVIALSLERNPRSYRFPNSSNAGPLWLLALALFISAGRAGPLQPMIPPAGPRIDDFAPKRGGMGDIITITGGGFGQNPDNICAVIMDGQRSIPLQVLAATDTQIRAMLGPVAPEAKPGPIMIALGQGAAGFFK